jgi:SAM-dependent methyltransferase
MTERQDTMPQAHFESQEALEQTYWWHVNRRKMALSLLDHLGVKAPRLLDLGCGTGGFLGELARQTGATAAVGLDASPVGLQAARKLGLDAREADLSRPLKLEDEAFDVATAMDVLEHLPDEQPLLETARLNLKPGGYFIASVPAYQSLFSTWDQHLGHYRRYTRPRLAAALAKSGLKVMRVSYAFSYALPPAVARRLFGKDYSENSCVFPPVPRLVNGALLALGSMEAALLPHMPIPFGLSVCALARRDAS